jgi:hypothetical protein
MKGKKVLQHPDREEIVKKLLGGESVKGVEKWLLEKYPRKKRLQISYATLQSFRTDYLNVKGDVLDDIKRAKKEKDLEEDEIEAKAIITASSAYQQKIDEIVSKELDTNRKLLEISALISARMEYYYNMISAGGSLQKEKMFLDLVKEQRGLIQDWKRYVEGAADKRVEHNINVSVINEQVTVLKGIVFEVLQELDPELVPVFVDKVNKKLEDTNYGSPKYNSYQEVEVIDAEYIE